MVTFWGLSLDPDKPHTLQWDADNAGKRLRITQATLAENGRFSSIRSVVRCAVGVKSPISICALIPKQFTTCRLDLEFEEHDDVVFSVTGLIRIHLAGYYKSPSSTSTTEITAIDDTKAEINGKEDVPETGNGGSNEHNPEDSDTQISSADKLLLQVGDLGNEASLVECITDEKREGVGEGGIPIVCINEYVNTKDADNNVEIENVMEQINGKTCEKSEDLDKITPGGSRNKIEQSADDIAGLSSEYLPNEQEKVVNEENRSVLWKYTSQVTEADVCPDDANTVNSGLVKLLSLEEVANSNQDQSPGSREAVLFEDRSLDTSAGNGYTRSHNNLQEEKKMTENLENQTVLSLLDHDMADGLTKEAFQQGNDNYIIKERKKDISKGKATVGSSVKEQILFEESNDHKRKRDLEDRNTNREVTGSSTSQRKKLKKSKVEGPTLGIEDGKNEKDLQGYSKGCKLAMGLTAAAALDGAKKIHDKTSSERVEKDSGYFIGSANIRAQSENVLLAAVEKLCGLAIPQREKKMKVRVGKKAVTPPDHALESLELRNKQGSGISMSRRKKEKKVKLGECILGEKFLNSRGHALGSLPESPNDRYVMDSITAKALDGAKSINDTTLNQRIANDDSFLVGSTDCISDRKNSLQADTIEQVSSLSVSQRKKKKKARVGDGTPGKKISDPKDYALGLHAELPNESTVNGDTHAKELKIKKRKKGKMESQIISAMVENNELQTISKEHALV